MPYHHTPVMLKEALEYLNPKPGQNFIDCTLGGGGHAIELAKKVGAKGKVLGIDLDKDAIKAAESNAYSQDLNNIVFIQDNYKNLTEIINECFTYPIHGILLDLGLSSAQLQARDRGFSFQTDGKLDMRFNAASQPTTAEDIVNKWPEQKLTEIFKQYGEEPNAKKIAQAIVRHRKIAPISTTFELSKIVNNIVNLFNKKIKKPHSAKGCGKPPTCPPMRRMGRNPATRVFQALRIAVNNELENLKQTLPQALKVLEPGARLAIISFHSLEDRIVKEFFKQESRGCLCPPNFPICQCNHKAQIKIITKKPVVPSIEEVRANPRSRSAKLRVAERIHC